jgi:hypothetical protein
VPGEEQQLLPQMVDINGLGYLLNPDSREPRRYRDGGARG